MIITGDIGVIMVGYHRAASVARWTLSMNQSNVTLGGVAFQRLTFDATVKSIDKFWITNTNFSLRLLMGVDPSGGEVWWVWDGLVMIDGRLRPGEVIQAAVAGTPIIKVSGQ